MDELRSVNLNAVVLSAPSRAMHQLASPAIAPGQKRISISRYRVTAAVRAHA